MLVFIDSRIIIFHFLIFKPMGYGITPYRVNLMRVNSRFGNSNPSKRSKAYRACQARLLRVDEQ